MRRFLLSILLAGLLVLPVSAVEITAPEVPQSGAAFMPGDTTSFGEGLWSLVREALANLRPDLAEASGVCLSAIVVVLLVSILETFPGNTKKTADLAGAVAISALLLQGTNSLIRLGTQTIRDLSEYGKLLLPVMTSAMAAQGGLTGSTALYTGTALFDTVLVSLIRSVLVPMIYLYLAVSATNSAVGEDILKRLAQFLKWLMVWCLKIVLYVFTGYMGITGVVSGTTDAAALKAAKLTISGVVPVVGGILSDASEAVLVSAGVVKNAAGIYGIFAILAVCIGPFLRIGTHYLMLKATAAICAIFGSKRTTELIGDFSAAMGVLLAMTGSVCLLLLISTVCFLRGVG